MRVTKRELEISEHLMSGNTSKVISDDVGISIKNGRFPLYQYHAKTWDQQRC